MPHDTDPIDLPTKGRWSGLETAPGDVSVLNDGEGVFAIHASLMHTGRVLLFSGRTDAEFDGNLYRSWSWDPVGHETGDALTGVIGRWFVAGFDEDDILPTTENGDPDIAAIGDPDINLFCSHHVFREDGKLLVMGGDAPTISYLPDEISHPAHDNRALHLYDPETESWSKLPSPMYMGRWYPTSVMMPDGRITIFSGNTAFTYAGITPEVEIVGPPNYVPQRVNGGLRRLFLYPGMHLIKGGSVFYTGTAWSYLTDAGTDAEREAQLLTRLNSNDSFIITGANSDGEPQGTWESHDMLPDNPFREKGTSVLLPPARDGRILLIGGNWLNTNSPSEATSVEILDTQNPPLAWEPAGNMNYPRINVTTVLLPNGKVLILGGHYQSGGAIHNHSNIAEIYNPDIPYDETNLTAAFTEVAELHKERAYHSIALLLPDGRVLTAGGIGIDNETANRDMEFYEPPYMHLGTRPTIDSLSRVDVAPPADGFIKKVGYGGEITVGYTSDAPITKVVFMRPGSITHHTDTEQRYEDVAITPTVDASGTFQVSIPSDPSVLPPGYYMLWIVDDQDRPCELAKFVRLSHESCSIIDDRSHLSIHAYNAAAGATGIAEFSASSFVVLHGFIPSELGITELDPDITGAIPPGYVPTINIFDGAAPISETDLALYPIALHLEHPVDVEHPTGSLDIRQRITFEYGIRITTDTVFPVDDGDPDTIEQRELELRIESNGFLCSSNLTLVRQPNPYMLDGEKPWLSTDLRVFQVRESQNQSGVTLNDGAAPLTYLTDFIDACRADTDATSVTHPFEQIATDQQDAKLELAPMVDGDLVYNYAIARVRMRAPIGVSANDVHVFFRLFTTAVASLQYNTATTYVRTAAAPFIAEVAETADEILTIPCYATSRDSVTTDGDTPNILPINGTGDDQYEYYGVWLDINQTDTPLIDPATSNPISVKNVLNGRHQCLCAEIFYAPDPIPDNATPGNNDNLSQRNLAIIDSDNPGGPDAHTVVHTFDLQPTWGLKRKQKRGEFEAVNFANTANVNDGRGFESQPDELMITWDDMPHDAIATVYFPDLEAETIIALSALEGRSAVLERVDAHTIRCPIADITYIPLPVVSGAKLAGLLTIVMPETVRDGETYRVTARHYSRIRGRLLGSFEVLIPVRLAKDLRRQEARDFALLQNMASKRLPTSRWRPIFERYLGTLADRLRGMGVNPSRIPPSDDGYVPEEDAGLGDTNCHGKCCREQWFFTALLATGLVLVALLPYLWAVITGGLTFIGLSITFLRWRKKCGQSCCDILTAGLLGTGTATVVTGIVALSGQGATQTMLLLSIFGAVTAVQVVVWLAKCLRAHCCKT